MRVAVAERTTSVLSEGVRPLQPRQLRHGAASRVVQLLAVQLQPDQSDSGEDDRAGATHNRTHRFVETRAQGRVLLLGPPCRDCRAHRPQERWGVRQARQRCVLGRHQARLFPDIRWFSNATYGLEGNRARGGRNAWPRHGVNKGLTSKQGSTLGTSGF